MKHSGMFKIHASGIFSGRNPVLYLLQRKSQFRHVVCGGTANDGCVDGTKNCELWEGNSE